jgi:hypothetical protein
LPSWLPSWLRNQLSSRLTSWLSSWLRSWLQGHLRSQFWHNQLLSACDVWYSRDCRRRPLQTRPLQIRKKYNEQKRRYHPG